MVAIFKQGVTLQASRGDGACPAVKRRAGWSRLKVGANWARGQGGSGVHAGAFRELQLRKPRRPVYTENRQYRSIAGYDMDTNYKRDANSTHQEGKHEN